MKRCLICEGEGWVCETHPYQAWTAAGCQCSPGVLCICTKKPKVPDDATVLASTRPHTVKRWLN